MRKTIIALAMLGTIVAQAHATDPLDIALKNRHTMVAAVALLMTLPPKCAIDNKNPPADLIALRLFIMATKAMMFSWRM